MRNGAKIVEEDDDDVVDEEMIMDVLDANTPPAPDPSSPVASSSPVAVTIPSLPPPAADGPSLTPPPATAAAAIADCNAMTLMNTNLCEQLVKKFGARIMKDFGAVVEA